jgi:hypothetical protein
MKPSRNEQAHALRLRAVGGRKNFLRISGEIADDAIHLSEGDFHLLIRDFMQYAEVGEPTCELVFQAVILP